MWCSALQCDAVRYSALQCDAVRCSAMQSSEMGDIEQQCCDVCGLKWFNEILRAEDGDIS